MSESLITFSHTTDAIAAERALLSRAIDVRVMPMPGAIRAGCGICLRVSDWAVAVAALLDAGVAPEGVYAMAAGQYAPIDWTFAAALGLRPGDMAALVGCGGKTSLMWRLAREWRGEKVLVTTTTRIRRPEPEAYDHEVRPEGPLLPGINLLAGEAVEGGKVASPPVAALAALRAEDALVLIEADGSRGLPLKGWAAYEPVIPEEATVTIGVCAITPLGGRVSAENTHRPALFEALTGAAIGDGVTLDILAAMVSHSEGLFGKAHGRRVLYINQVEGEQALAAARALAGMLPEAFVRGLSRIVCGSLREGRHMILYEGES